MEILQRARGLVQNNHLLSTQHVMLEALERPDQVGMEWQELANPSLTGTHSRYTVIVSTFHN